MTAALLTTTTHRSRTEPTGPGVVDGVPAPADGRRARRCPALLSTSGWPPTVS